MKEEYKKAGKNSQDCVSKCANQSEKSREHCEKPAHESSKHQAGHNNKSEPKHR
jgi:hypothetical protein